MKFRENGRKNEAPHLHLFVHKVKYHEKVPKWSFPGHTHDQWTELYFVDRGVIDAEIGPHQFQLKSGEMVLIPPHIHHRFRSASKKAPNFLNVIFRNEGIALGSICLELIRLSGEQLQIIRSVLRDLNENHPFPAAIAESAIALLLLQLLRRDPEDRTSRGGALRESLVDRAKQVLFDKHAKPFGHELFKGVAPMSSARLEEIFREETGETLRSAHGRARVDRAKILLREAEMNVLQIALAVGYRFPGDLTRAFRAVENMTPTEYLRSVKPRRS